MPNFFSRLLSIAVLLFLAAPPASALSVPRGFRTVDEAPGVMLYRQRRNYVQVVSLREGAKVHVLHGKFYEEGSHGSFTRKPMREWWTEFAEESDGAFSVVNGQFFDTANPDAAPLAFSIKADGKVYEGYGDATEYPGRKRMLVLYDDPEGAPVGGRAFIDDYTDDPVSLVDHTAPDILVGLEPTAAKTLARALPRTFAGVARTGEVLLFSSSMATQASATRTLRAFGAPADQILMLDGGKSAHLFHNGNVLVPVNTRGNAEISREEVPQVLGVEAAAR